MAEVELSTVDGPGSAPLLVMVGSFYLSNVELVDDVLLLWSAQGHRRAVLDMTRTSYIGSAAVAALVQAQRRGMRLSVRGATGTVRSTLVLAVLSNYLEMETASP